MISNVSLGITERQAIAYAHPSARAMDNLDERFFRFVKRGGYLWSTILSVNK